MTISDRILQLERDSSVLDPDVTGRAELRDAAVESAERFLSSVGTMKAYYETDHKGSRLLDLPISPHGAPLDRVIASFEDNVVHPGGHPAAGGHLAYIPGSGLYHSAIADFLAAVSNKYAGIFFSAPGAVRMENMLLRWVAEIVGYPPSATGNIASGGSIATLNAIATARDAHSLRSADYATSVIYLTSHAHHCVEKALRLAGLADAQVRHVPMDARYRMQAGALAAMIAADKSSGLKPWLVVASAGTTHTGAVDPLDEIADVAEQEKLWYHVDAAYGGFFVMTDYGRNMLRGIERSDSVVLDPHKSLFLPFGNGIVLVRDGARLAAAHGATGHYMQDATSEPGEASPADVSPELTKHFRALRMWLPLILLGTTPFSAALDEKLLLARYFHERIQHVGFEAGPEPDLSVVTFRLVRKGATLQQENAMNEHIVDAMRRDGRIFISSTMLDGKFTLRMVALQFRTHLREIDLAIELLGRHASELLASPWGA